MPDSKGIEPVVVQTFRMEVADGLAAAALIPSRLCSAADETAKVREIVPAITAADQVAAARKAHLWRDRANCSVVQVPRRTAGLRAFSLRFPLTQRHAVYLHDLEADLRPIRRDWVGRSAL